MMVENRDVFSSSNNIVTFKYKTFTNFNNIDKFMTNSYVTKPTCTLAYE